MSRTFTDESTLTTLCPRCLNAFRNTQTNFGYDYYIQPTSPKATSFKKGRFDDESECA